MAKPRPAGPPPPPAPPPHPRPGRRPRLPLPQAVRDGDAVPRRALAYAPPQPRHHRRRAPVLRGSPRRRKDALRRRRPRSCAPSIATTPRPNWRALSSSACIRSAQPPSQPASQPASQPVHPHTQPDSHPAAQPDNRPPTHPPTHTPSQPATHPPTHPQQASQLPTHPPTHPPPHTHPPTTHPPTHPPPTHPHHAGEPRTHTARERRTQSLNLPPPPTHPPTHPPTQPPSRTREGHGRRSAARDAPAARSVGGGVARPHRRGAAPHRRAGSAAMAKAKAETAAVMAAALHWRRGCRPTRSWRTRPDSRWPTAPGRCSARAVARRRATEYDARCPRAPSPCRLRLVAKVATSRVVVTIGGKSQHVNPKGGTAAVPQRGEVTTRDHRRSLRQPATDPASASVPQTYMIRCTRPLAPWDRTADSSLRRLVVDADKQYGKATLTPPKFKPQHHPKCSRESQCDRCRH